MNNTQQHIKQLTKSISEDQESLNYIIENEELLASCPFKISFSGWDTRVIINDIKDLHDARAFMSKLFGTSQYSYDLAFYSMGRAIATFVNKEKGKKVWAIWLECSFDEFPKELMPSDKCSWQETVYKDFNLVCERD